MRRAPVLFGFLLSVSALAQAPLPSVSPFPLEFKRTPTAFSKKDAEEVRRDFVRLTRKVALVPDTASQDAALKELKRQDCDVSDECLKLLATKGQTLYAVFAQVEYTVSGQVVAMGRVVRDDGKLVSGPETVSIVKGKESFKEVTKVALTRLLEQLGVPTLPTFREVEKPPEPPKVVVVEPARPAEPSKTEPPPPPPPLVIRETGTPPLKMAAYVAMGVGGAAIIAGAVVAATAKTNLNTDRVIEPAAGETGEAAVAAYRAAKSQQTAGQVVLGLGAAVAVTGVVLMFLPSGSNAVAVVPVNGGAVVSLGGAF